MEKVVSYTNVRENLAQIMSEVCNDKIPTRITRRNGDNCVLMSEDEYDSIQETLYLFSNPANADHLVKSLQDAKEGKFVMVDLSA